MDVTRHNFQSLLPSIVKVINDADFLAIDGEFTGLMNGKRINPFDTPSEYYTGVLEAATDFLLIQFGLCAFRWDEAAGTHKYHAYNFYVFPWGRAVSDKSFLCEISSIDFLAKQGLDFNKVFREGISYLTVPVEKKLRDQLEEKQKSQSEFADNHDEITIPDDSKEYIKDICSRVNEFLIAKDQESLIIDRCNAFQRKLCYQELRKKFSRRIYIESKVDSTGFRVLCVSRCTEAEKAEREEKNKQKEWAELEQSVGFSKLMRVISQSEKLVVGHNMLLDVIHTLHNFFAPLPTDYAEFKEFAHCIFPTLLDNKFMCSVPPFKDRIPYTMLADVLATVAKNPFKIAPLEGECPECSYELDAKREHEAAFDALLTGRCFLSMYAYLQNNVYQRIELSRLRPYINKLYLAKTAFSDSPYINLTGKDFTPCRDHVFHLSFRKEWKRDNIVQLFSPFGQVYISFLNETSALVALLNKENVMNVLRSLKSTSMFTITTFQNYKTNLESTKKPTFNVLSRLSWRAPTQAPSEVPASIQTSSTSDEPTATKEPPTSEAPPIPEAPWQIQGRSRKRKHGDAPFGLAKKAVEGSVNDDTESKAVNEGWKLAKSHRAGATKGRRKRRTSSGTFSVEEIKVATSQDQSKPVQEQSNSVQEQSKPVQEQSRPVQKAGNSLKSRVVPSQPWRMGKILEDVRKQKNVVDLGQAVKREEVAVPPGDVPPLKKVFKENSSWE